MILEKLKTVFIAVLSCILLFFVTLTVTQRHSLNELQTDKSVLQKIFDYSKLLSNKKLGLAKTNLITQEELTRQYKKELEDRNSEFEQFRIKHELQIASKDEMIAKLIGEIEDGKTVTTGECLKDKAGKCKPVQYFWEDKLGRFKLIDPDIWTQNNEKFFFSQFFRVKGEIFSDKQGSFKVRKVKIEELYDSDQNKPGLQAALVPNSKLQILDNNFNYVADDQKKTKSFSDIFTFKPMITLDTQINAGVGFEVINLGRYFDYLNFGLYPKASVSFNDGIVSALQGLNVGIGVNYHIVPPLLPTNFALGISLNFPTANLQTPTLTADIILYLTEDLNPFVEK